MRKAPELVAPELSLVRTHMA